MKQKPKYFYRIFLPFVVAGVLAMILFNGFAYFFTKNSLEEKIMLEKQENVVQTMTTLEQKLQAVDYTFNSYIYDPSFERLMEQPLAPEHFDTYKAIDRRLNYISSFGPNQTTAELISFDGNWNINDSGLQQLTDARQDQLYADYMALPNASTWLKSEAGPAEIKLVKKVPLHKTEKSGAVVIHIPLESLSSLIYKQDKSSPIFIYNKSGQLLYESGPAEDTAVPESVLASLIKDERKQIGVMSAESDGGEYTFAYSKSLYNGWLYVSKIDQAEFSAAMKPTVIGTVAMGILMLALTVLIAYLSSDYFSKPIQELQTLIPKIKGDSYKDEFELIGSTIRGVIDKNESLEHMVISQKEQLKTLFMINLFHGRKSEEEIQEELSKFYYSDAWKTLYVLGIQIDSADHQKYTSKEKDILLFGINKIVSEVIDEQDRLTPAMMDSKTQATIFIGRETNPEETAVFVQKHADTIQRTVRELFNISVSIGISLPYKKLSESERALEQAASALKYRLKVGREAIVFYETVFNNYEVRTYFPKQLESQLFEAMKVGDSEKAKEQLDLLLADLFQNNANANEMEVNIMRFINDLIGLMQLMGMDTFIIENHKTLYNAVFEMETFEEVELFLKNKLVYPMIQLMEQRGNSEYKTISEQIIHIIQQEFDTKLTLESIGARLHYNPNYLSEIFKKEFKQSFSDYVAEYRFGMAKHWLKETTIPVKDIAQRLQYNNSQNFIRFFRKMEGITPGKYREEHRYDVSSFAKEEN